ncbi:MAG TPA: ABC transporter permease [Acidimicrobiales bacterium]|jgi:sulfonate transport system permease protein
MAVTHDLLRGPPADAGTVDGHAAASTSSTAGEPINLTRPIPQRRRRVGVRVPRFARRVVGPIALVGIWQLVCSAGVFTSTELASPVAVFDAARQLWDTGSLQSNLLVSLQRVVEGLAVGISVGVILSVLSGLFWIGEDLLDPVVHMARSVPILGLLPLAIIWFGVGELPKIFLIALGTTFPVYLNTYAGIRGVDAKLVEAGQTFGLNRWGMVRKVILPGALPGFLTGLRFALVGCWLIIIVAEEINAQSGIGYLIMQAQTTDRTDIMFVGLAIYAILGLVAEVLVRLLERRLLSWRRGFTGA